MYAVGANGTILRSDGTEWTPVYSTMFRRVWGVQGNASDVFVVGNGGNIAHDAGIGFAASVSGTGLSLIAVWVDANGRAVAGGANGVIIEYAPLP